MVAGVWVMMQMLQCTNINHHQTQQEEMNILPPSAQECRTCRTWVVAASYSCELWELCCVSTAPAPIGAPAHIGATTTTICCTEDSTEVSADETFFFIGFQTSATSEKKYGATSSKLEAWCKFEAETTGRTTSTVVDAKSTAVQGEIRDGGRSHRQRHHHQG